MADTKDILLDQSLQDRILEFRHYLHAHPELSMQEYETTDYLERQLTALGLRVRKIQSIGLIAELHLDDRGPIVGIRAEIDALPIAEETGLPFASQNPGVMHACGHDANAAVALGVILYLVSHREEYHGTFRFLFEPGEEVGQGAKLLMDAGALEDPPLDALFIFHFANEPEEGMEIQQDISTAAVGGITIRVEGRSCHFSERQKGVDAVLASGEVLRRISRLQETYDCGKPFVLGFGLIQGGQKANIMADEVTLQGSLRTFTDESFRDLYQTLERELSEAEKITGAKVTMSLNRVLPSFRNDPDLVRLGMEAGRKIYGGKAVLGTEPFLVGDNAALYCQKVRGLRMVFFAGKKGEEHFPLHHSRFDLDENAMIRAVCVLAELLKKMQV